MQEWLEAPRQSTGAARPLRIAQIVPNLCVGGQERMTVALCEAQAARGIESIIIGYEPAPGGAAVIESTVPYLQLDRRRAGFAKQLRGMLRDTGFDLAHAQGPIPAIHLADALGGNRLLPSIATMHIGMAGTRRWTWQVRKALQAMDMVSAVSPDMAETYARLSARPVTLTPNGIDVARFAALPMSKPSPQGPFRFAMLSRLDRAKRHLDAIGALDTLRAEGLNAELHIAGEGAMEAALRAAAKARPWVSLAGSVADPAEFLRGKHALVMPSLAEGIPLALAEALAAGLPAVLSDLPSLRAMAGQAALYATAGDRSALTIRMRELAGNEIVRFRAARLARGRAERFALDSVASAWTARYHALYEQAHASLL